MRFAGLDVHKPVVDAAIIDGKGAVKKRARFCCTGEEIGRFARDRLQASDKVALEATANSWGVVAVLKPVRP